MSSIESISKNINKWGTLLVLTRMIETGIMEFGAIPTKDEPDDVSEFVSDLIKELNETSLFSEYTFARLLFEMQKLYKYISKGNVVDSILEQTVELIHEKTGMLVAKSGYVLYEDPSHTPDFSIFSNALANFGVLSEFIYEYVASPTELHIIQAFTDLTNCLCSIEQQLFISYVIDKHIKSDIGIPDVKLKLIGLSFVKLAKERIKKSIATEQYDFITATFAIAKKEKITATPFNVPYIEMLSNILLKMQIYSSILQYDLTSTLNDTELDFSKVPIFTEDNYNNTFAFFDNLYEQADIYGDCKECIIDIVKTVYEKSCE